MVQKTIWMLLLVTGILSSLYSCKERIENVHIDDYYYVNNTNYNMRIESFNKIDNEFKKHTYSLSKGSSFFQQIEFMSGSTTGIIALSDSVFLSFEDIKTISFLPSTQTSTFNILNINNYKFNKKSDNHFEYTYVFIDNDFQNAVEIE